MGLESIRARIDRIRRTEGVDPPPTGFLLSVAPSGNVMIVIGDLGLPEDAPLTISAEGACVRILHGGTVVLRVDDASARALAALRAAPRIDVLETDSDAPLRIHEASLSS